MTLSSIKQKLLALGTILACFSGPSDAFAAITFGSSSNPAASLLTTIDDNGNTVFVIGGLADGESTDLTFAIDSTCPMVAMTGGAEFGAPWDCTGSVITASVTYRGGMSFGPATDELAGSFYVTFSNPPAPPGSDTAPEAFDGVQISLYGDISSWDLDGGVTEEGATFGVELSGTQGGEAHFRLYLPQAAVAFLGNILGVSVGGKPYPFATVTTNEDGSVTLAVDIEALKGEAASSSRRVKQQKVVTNSIVAGARTLGVGFGKSSAKSGKAVSIAMCAGAEFTAGDKVPVKFTVGGKSAGIKKSFTLDSTGCAQTTVKLKAVRAGTLTAKVNYGGETARGTVKVTQ